MNSPVLEPDYFDTARFVEVLCSNETGDPYGYRMGGERVGPNVLVIGYADHTEKVFERLARLPTLPWMWGKLFIVMLDGLDEISVQNARKLLPDVPIDETLLLPYAALDGAKGLSADQDYWQVLNTCARLGMIAGRGIRSLH